MLGDKSQTLTNDKHCDTMTNRTTLNPDYRCDNCGEPAMTREQGYGRVTLRCPSCWLREKGQQIKPIDPGGYYP